jgi:hypothetical protein
LNDVIDDFSNSDRVSSDQTDVQARNALQAQSALRGLLNTLDAELTEALTALGRALGVLEDAKLMLDADCQAGYVCPGEAGPAADVEKQEAEPKSLKLFLGSETYRDLLMSGNGQEKQP